MSKATRSINGFLAWCESFVGSVRDNNGTPMPMEWAEQLEALRRDAVETEFHIPDIRSDVEVIRVLDELKYRLKPAQWVDGNPVAKALNAALNTFVIENKLDDDPHSFASLPSEEK